MIESGFIPVVLILVKGLSVLRSNTVTVASPPLLVKPLPRSRRQGHAVDAHGVGNVADHFAGNFVDNHHVRAARDVDAVGVRIHSEVVPAAVAADRHSANHLEASALRRGIAAGPKCQKRRTSQEPSTSKRSYTSSW